MNPSEEQNFFDLATKVIANRATEKERREFDQLLDESKEHRERFEIFKADLIVARDMVSLIDAADATGAGLNEKQLERLQKDVERFATQPQGVKSNRTPFLIFLLLGSLLVIVVAILMYFSSSLTKTLTSDDVSTPDEIIVITINSLNNRQSP